MTTAPDHPGPDPVEHRITVPRTARYYALGDVDTASDAWVVLHGFGQLARKFIGQFRPASAPGRLIVAPEALSRYYTDHAARKVGATWMTSEDRLTEIADYVRYLDLVVDDVRAGPPAPTGRLEVHGFSQGTVTASRWAAFGRHQPDRLVLWGGGLPPDLDLEAHGPRLNGMDLTVVIGDRDEFISEEAIQDQVRQLEAAGVGYRLIRFPGGHTVPGSVLEAMAGLEKF
ncbi:MAG TPA: hypothetical protein VLL51_08670 [Gemmatimonadales bacterium]|nr:hypothetical protein [Gemmatimonadales bacterium]